MNNHINYQPQHLQITPVDVEPNKGSRGAAIVAVVISCFLFLYCLFIAFQPLADIILRSMDQQTMFIIFSAQNLLAMVLGVCIFLMTKNTSGTWAGWLYFVYAFILFVSNVAFVIYLSDHRRISPDFFFASEGCRWACWIMMLLISLALPFLLKNAVKGVAGILLMVGFHRNVQ